MQNVLVYFEPLRLSVVSSIMHVMIPCLKSDVTNFAKQVLVY